MQNDLLTESNTISKDKILPIGQDPAGLHRGGVVKARRPPLNSSFSRTNKQIALQFGMNVALAKVYKSVKDLRKRFRPAQFLATMADFCYQKCSEGPYGFTNKKEGLVF